jgi:hypothetical protein
MEESKMEKMEETIKEKRLLINETEVQDEDKSEPKQTIIDKLFFENSLGKNLFPRLKVHLQLNNRTKSQERTMEYL